MDAKALEAKIVEALKGVYDPEIPVSIYELGLIYEIRVGEDGRVHVVMTLTSPGCPEAQSLPGRAEAACRAVEGVADVEVEVVWTPPWGPQMMSEAARLVLGF